MALPKAESYCPEPPSHIRLSPVFNLDGPEAAARWMRDELEIPATERWIHEHTIQGNIRYAKIVGRRFYSSLELYKFMMAQNKFGGGKSA